MTRPGDNSEYAAASHWLARLRDEGTRDAESAEFYRWLDADAGNRQRFERVSQIWEDVGGIGHSLERSTPEKRQTQYAGVGRRGVLAGMAVAVLSVGGIARWDSARAATYSTSVGEQKRFVLDDGTRLMLDTATRLEARFDDAARTISLSSGRIHCTVAADPRPFVVEAGSNRLIAQAGRFTVDHGEGAAAFVAESGAAKVEAEGAAAASVISIQPGERLREAEGRLVRDRPKLSDITAWQTGRAIFRDVALADVVAEMNRYNADQPLHISSPALKRMRVSGIYRVGNNIAFAETLSEMLPIQAVVEDGGVALRPM